MKMSDRHSYDFFVVSVLFSLLSIFLISVDRSVVLDNDSYLAYFSDSDLLTGFFDLIVSSDAALKIFLIFVSEEFLWLCYATLLGGFLSPDVAVVFTVLLVNFLVIFSFWKLGVGPFGFLLWCALPVCLSVIGFFQIRQGLALGVFLCWVVLGMSPLFGALVASMIHTTFIVPFVVLLFMRVGFLKANPLFFAIALCFIMSVSVFGLQGFFGDFAGRRSEIYSITDGAESINFVLGVVLLCLPSVYIAFFCRNLVDECIFELAMLHIGISIWLVVAFLIFPLGTARVGYYSQVFSIFSGGVVFLGRFSNSILVVSIYFFMCFVLVYGGFRDGSYSQLSFSYFF